jgi:hypothetical protein
VGGLRDLAGPREIPPPRLSPQLRTLFLPHLQDQAPLKFVNNGRRAARAGRIPPRATIFIASSGNGLCSASASSHGARIHTSRSSSVVRVCAGALSGSWMALSRLRFALIYLYHSHEYDGREEGYQRYSRWPQC